LATSPVGRRDPGNPPTIGDALTVILAALSLLGLSIFGSAIANA
jgi:type IV secretion system protein TrbL